MTAHQDLSDLKQILDLANDVTVARAQEERVNRRQELEVRLSEVAETIQKNQAQVAAFDRVVKALDDANKEAIVREGSKYLSGDMKLHFKINGRVVEIGIHDGEKVITGASGSQGVELVTALLSVLPVQSDGRALVLCLPDTDWDPVHLADFMRAIKDSPHQILLASTQKPKGRFPAGWTLVELEAPGESSTPKLKVVEGGKAKPPKVKDAPKPPSLDGRDPPSWLVKALARWEPTLIANLQAWAEEEGMEKHYPSGADLMKARKYTSSEGVYHEIESLKVVSFTPLNPKGQRWLWRKSTAEGKP